MSIRNPEALGRIKRLLLASWDPIGVGHIPEAQDEYDGYAPGVLARVRHGAPAAEIAAYLGWARTDRMGLPPDPEVDLQIAEQAIALARPAPAANQPERD